MLRWPVILLGVLSCDFAACSAFATGGSSADLQAVLVENEHAREKFRLGINAFRAGRFEEARQLLTEAWRLRRTYDVAAALAHVNHELGHDAQAAELLDFCLRNFAPIESDTKLSELQHAYEEVARRVGRIDLSAVPNGSEVRVDNELVGTIPLGMVMYLEAGLHEFTFRIDGKSLPGSLLVQPGQQYRVPIDPKYAAVTRARSPESAKPRLTGSDGGASHEAAASPLAGGTLPTFPYYLGGALIVAGAATGATFHLAANHATRRVEDLRSKLGVSDCNNAGATANELCRSLDDAITERSYDRNLAILGYGVASTAALATIVYWLWPESEHAVSAACRSQPTWAVTYAPSQLWLAVAGVLP